MVYDFHTHTLWSDGELSVVEHIRRAVVAGYRALGITDHIGVGGLRERIEAIRADRDLAERYWPIRVVIGVELTHVPPEAIPEAARLAREVGAEIVVLHGETPVEPVCPGSNRAALESGLVDVIGHPGHLTEEEARLARDRDIFLELSARRGHSLTNGRVARVAQAAGAKLIVDSDAHAPSDFLSDAFQRSVALGAGIDEALLPLVLETWPEELLARALARRGG
ncbi:MAG: histidinol phosphate phosphatase domain-containing protein [Thermomicrobiaceae bacterium]|nr:histidinol phosphate phosphatase domain-containing protein [Thermomicrobiaceae bacterium]